MTPPYRIAVVGNSGSGKTAMSRLISDQTGYPHVELDSIHHLPNWTPIDREEMRRIVTERIEGDSWVVDGNYRKWVQDLVFAAADTVVWLDLPRRTIMPRIVRRTLGRMVLRRELWNGNRERFRSLFDADPEENIILWSWTQHDSYRKQYEEAMADPANAHLTWERLRSTRDVRRWAATLGLE